VSIGQTLSAARREAGLSIEDISARTRLRATVLRAIENDDFSLCGGDFYARGHIRTIASMVGADAAALVAEYDARVAHPEDTPAASQVFEAEVAGQALTRRTERRAPNWGIAAAVMVLLVVIVVAGVHLATRSGKNNPTGLVAAGTASSSPSASVSPPRVTSLETPSASSSATATQPTETSQQTPPASPPTSAIADARVHVVLNVTTARCWVLALASNGDQLYEGTLNPGESRTFVDAQRVSLKLGNAPATDLTVNGVDIGTPPSTSSVATVSFGPGDPTTAQG
jgi:cytoskeletal protein RodZ